MHVVLSLKRTENVHDFLFFKTKVIRGFTNFERFLIIQKLIVKNMYYVMDMCLVIINFICCFCFFFILILFNLIKKINIIRN